MSSTVRSHGNIPKKLIEAENTAIFAPPEVPKCAIEKMFEKVTSRFKEQISELDLLNFSQKNLLGFSAEKVSDMVGEALSTGFNYPLGQRRVVTGNRKSQQKPSPSKLRPTTKSPPKRFLTVKDVQAAVRTRKDPNNKGLFIQRPFRDDWIAIIQAAHPDKRIFNFPQVHSIAPPLTLAEQWDQYEEDLKARNEPLFKPHLFEPRFDHMETVFAKSDASISAFSNSINKLSPRTFTSSTSRPRTTESSKSLRPRKSAHSPQTFSSAGNDAFSSFPADTNSEMFTVNEDGPELSPGPRRNTLGRPMTTQSALNEDPSNDVILTYNRLYSPLGRPGSGHSATFPTTRPHSGESTRSMGTWMLTRASSLSPRSDLSRTLAPSYVSRGTRSAASTGFSTSSKRRPYNPRVDGLLPESSNGTEMDGLVVDINRLSRTTGQLDEIRRSNTAEELNIESPRPEESPRMGFREKGKHTELLETLQSNSVDRRKSRQAAWEAALHRQERDAAAARGRQKFRHQIGERSLQPQRFQDRQGWAQESLREAERNPMKKTDRDEVIRPGVFDYSLLKKTSEPQEIKSKIAGDQLDLYGRSPQAYYSRHDAKPYDHTFRDEAKGKKNFCHQPIPVSKAFPREKLATVLSTDGTDYVKFMKESGWKLDKIER